MTGLHSRIYDTSALLRFSNDEKGGKKIAAMLGECRTAGRKDKASCLSAYEFMFSTGRRSAKPMARGLAIFEDLIDFIPANFDITQRAAFLRLRYMEINLSMADAIIIQTGIDNDYEIVTCDKEWSKVSEAKVRVV